MFDNDNKSQWSNARTELPGTFASAVAEFRKSLQNSWRSANAEQKVLEAWARYEGVIQETWKSPEVVERTSDFYGAYTKAVREAFADRESRQHVLEAFQRFVETLKHAWADVDPQGVTPEHVAALAQSIMWVSSVSLAVSQAEDNNS
jgi:hypothetical protein